MCLITMLWTVIYFTLRTHIFLVFLCISRSTYLCSLFYFFGIVLLLLFFFFDKRPLKQDQGRRIKSEASRETFLQIHHIGSRVESFLYIFLF